MFVTMLNFEVIYEMQNNEFVVKDINTLISDLSVVYGFDEYKFEILENSIKDTKNPNVIDLSSKLGFDFKIYYEGTDDLANFTKLYFEYNGQQNLRKQLP